MKSMAYRKLTGQRPDTAFAYGAIAGALLSGAAALIGMFLAFGHVL